MPGKEATQKMEQLVHAYSGSWEGLFTIEGESVAPDEVIEALSPWVTEERKSKIDEVVAKRTRTVVPVVEGLVNTGNVSAVMRTAEALGLLDFHAVTNDQQFKQSERTSRGAEQWLNIFQWDRPKHCTDYLKKRGYKILALYLDRDAKALDKLNFTEKTALVFGNEQRGVSPEMRKAADETIYIPMGGFVESFNVSVAAAITLHHTRSKRLQAQGFHADLSEKEQEELKAIYLYISAKKPNLILKQLVHDRRTK